MFNDKPYSQACENNKSYILEVLQKHLSHSRNILEIGSGSGQHAVYFAEHLPHVYWNTSDQLEYHDGINAWIDSVNLSNIDRPFRLDVTSNQDWEDVTQRIDIPFDGVFSANTAHIMSWDAVVAMFRGVGQLFVEHGVFLLYGPFNKHGEFTSESNYRFDCFLKQKNNAMGIRDDQDIFHLANQNNLDLVDDIDMPANNRILVFRLSTALL